MSIMLFVSAIVAGLIFKKSKLCTMYLFVIMYLFAAFRTYDADYNTYKIGFNNLRNSSFRYAGYTSFLKTFSQMGFTFERYNRVFFLIVFSLLIIGVKLLTDNINLVLAAYLVYSYSLDVVQMKTAIANALALLSIAILIDINAKTTRITGRRTIRWLFAAICLEIAIYMHFSTVYYVFAIAVYYLIRNSRKKGIKVLVISVLMLVFLASGFLVLVMRYANILGILGDLEYMGRWATKSTRFGYLSYGIIIFLLIFSCRYNKHAMVKDNIQREISTFLMTAMLVFPFVYLNGEYSRLLRIYILLVYVIISKQSCTKMIPVKRIVNNMMCIGAMSLLFYLDIGRNYENVLGALLHSNSLLSITF